MRQVTQSSTHEQWYTDAARAVDGDLGVVYPNMAHTSIGDITPWWQVDLGQPAVVLELDILNRDECCKSPPSPL